MHRMMTDAEVKTEKDRITAQLWRMMDSVDDLAETVYGTDGPEPGEGALGKLFGGAGAGLPLICSPTSSCSSRTAASVPVTFAEGTLAGKLDRRRRSPL